MLHRRLPRLDIPGSAYYLTCCLDRRRALFRRAELANLLIDLYVAQRDRGAIRLHGYVVMPDHYHVVLTLREDGSVSGIVRGVHSLFARTCRKITGITGRIWQRRFYDHVIRDEADMRTKLVYLHNNPVRAELVDDHTAYRWSSSQFWASGVGAVRCDEWG